MTENINRSAFGKELPLNSVRLIKNQASTASCRMRAHCRSEHADFDEKGRMCAMFLSARYTTAFIANLIGYLVNSFGRPAG